MRRKVNFLAITLFGMLLLIIGSNTNLAYGQNSQFGKDCDLDLSYEIEKNSTGNDFTFLLMIGNGYGDAEIKVVDFMNSSKGIIESKTIRLEDFSKKHIPTFLNLKPSTYIIQIYISGKCVISVNGMDGIEIKDI